LVSIVLAIFGLDNSIMNMDKIKTKIKSENNLTSLLRFSQVGKGRWQVILGSVSIIGKLFSLLTINLFLPPSQLLIHPFYKFYANSPRSPALHYVIAKYLMSHNIIMIISAILLAVDIHIHNFNYSLSHATQNLLIAANIAGVPCLFLALLVLFRYYSAYDIWTSNGVHLVYLPDESQNDLETGDNDDDTDYDQTNITNIGEDTTLIATNDDSFDGVIPNAESTTLSNGDTISNNDDHEESTEADRNHLQKTRTKRIQIIKKKSVKKLNEKMKEGSCCSFVVDAAEVDVRGRWINVSD